MVKDMVSNEIDPEIVQDALKTMQLAIDVAREELRKEVAVRDNYVIHHIIAHFVKLLKLSNYRIIKSSAHANNQVLYTYAEAWVDLPKEAAESLTKFMSVSGYLWTFSEKNVNVTLETIGGNYNRIRFQTRKVDGVGVESEYQARDNLNKFIISLMV